MDTRKPKKLICVELGLGETLDAFKLGAFPTAEDVLRHVFFHLWSMKKPDSDDACTKVVDTHRSLDTFQNSAHDAQSC